MAMGVLLMMVFDGSAGMLPGPPKFHLAGQTEQPVHKVHRYGFEM